MAKSTFRPQPRDVEILALIGEMGLLDSGAIADRFWALARSDKACRTRLSRYEENGLVERLEPPHNFAGNIYRLTKRGADEVEKHTGQRPRRVPKKPKPLKPHLLPHRLGSIHTRLRFDDACRLAGLPEPEWIMQYDTDPNARPGDPDATRFLLTETFHSPRRVSCRPDAAFRLSLPGDPVFELAGYVEYDRDSEDLEYLRKTKLAGYDAFMKAKAYHRHWPGLQLFVVRVLFICPDQHRIDQIAGIVAGTPAAQYVRFAVEDDLQPETLLTDPIWIDSDGNHFPILKSPLPAAASSS